jgi:ABC-type polysaccharide/polyol phosphate transport system ATPase subunit
MTTKSLQTVKQKNKKLNIDNNGNMKGTPGYLEFDNPIIPNIKLNTNGTAVSVASLSKVFRLAHQRHSTIREELLRIFNKNTYENLYALKNVSFEVNKGEFFGIIGRNGSGKTTLLTILAGIFKPDQGVVSVNGTISPFLGLGVGFNPELTARDNVFINGLVLGLNINQIKEKYDAIFDFAELRKFEDSKIKYFSSGMYARLAFSVAIQMNRDILLMDEVLAVGDVGFRKKCLDYFDTVKKNSDKTIIFVSHDMSSIAGCNRVMLLEKGQVKYIGAPKEAIDRYHSIMASTGG